MSTGIKATALCVMILLSAPVHSNAQLGTGLWDSSYGGKNYEFLQEVLLFPDGSFLLAGSSESGDNGDKTTKKCYNDDW